MGSLSAVNGIRFLSMAWVILGHTYEVELAGAGKLFVYVYIIACTCISIFYILLWAMSNKSKMSGMSIIK